MLFWPLYLKEKVQALRVHADFPPACSHMPAGEALARTASAARVQRLIKKDLLTSKIFLRRVIRWKRVYLMENICFTQLNLLQRYFDRRPSELGIRYEGAAI